MNSRNHHMFASVGGWLFEDLAGIGQVRPTDPAYSPTDASQHGFRHAVLFPRVTAHAAVPYVQSEYASVAGTFALTWANLSGTTPLGQCIAGAPENAPVTFKCLGGVFERVVFASFGTPSGACSGGFAKGKCDAANTSAIIAAACIGQASCTIDVSTTVFGDPVRTKLT